MKGETVFNNARKRNHYLMVAAACAGALYLLTGVGKGSLTAGVVVGLTAATVDYMHPM